LCQAAGPDRCALAGHGPVAPRLNRLLAQLRHAPIPAPTADPPGELTYGEALTALKLAGLPDPSLWPVAAAALEAAIQGDASVAETIARGATTDQARMLFQEQGAALVCADSPARHPASAWLRVVDRLEEVSRIGGPIEGWHLAPCASWPASSANRYTGPWNATTRNPILVIGTRFDPNTPLRNARLAARRLGNAVLLTHDGHGHLSQRDPSTCVIQATSTYLINLTTPPPGTVCPSDRLPLRPRLRPTRPLTWTPRGRARLSGVRKGDPVGGKRSRRLKDRKGGHPMPEDTANDREGNTYSDQPRQVQEPEQTLAAAQPNHDARPAATPSPPQMPAPPQMTAAQRVRVAARRRDETDYIFHYWTALGWTILTLGIYGFYVFYQLIRRMRDHNARRLELLDAATTVAWDQAGRQGLQQEMAPSFERAAGHLAVLRQMTSDFREPVIWLLLAIVARGIAEIVAFVLLDQDLIKHSQAEAGAGHELSVIYGRLGQQLPSPDQRQVKGPDNYVGRILAAIVTLGIYMFWWFYNQIDEPNKHFTSNWAQEDELVTAVEAIS
jgi:hypothetical protein